MIDPEIWARSVNPYVILQNLTRERTRALPLDTKFRTELERLVSARTEYLNRPCWWESLPAASAVRTAYFSMEFSLGEALPPYAGGLGILAGDHPKAASNLGIPLAGVGLLYQEGYFRQILDVSCEQRKTYPYNDTASMPVSPVQSDEGDWLHISIEYPGRVVRFRWFFGERVRSGSTRPQPRRRARQPSRAVADMSLTMAPSEYVATQKSCNGFRGDRRLLRKGVPAGRVDKIAVARANSSTECPPRRAKQERYQGHTAVVAIPSRRAAEGGRPNGRAANIAPRPSTSGSPGCPVVNLSRAGVRRTITDVQAYHAARRHRLPFVVKLSEDFRDVRWYLMPFSLLKSDCSWQ